LQEIGFHALPAFRSRFGLRSAWAPAIYRSPESKMKLTRCGDEHGEKRAGTRWHRGIGDQVRNVKGIEEFDSYERNFGLEFGCWSTSRATNHATQPRNNMPNTRVENEGSDRTVPNTGRGKSRRNERGLSTNESDPRFLERHN